MQSFDSGNNSDLSWSLLPSQNAINNDTDSDYFAQLSHFLQQRPPGQIIPTGNGHQFDAGGFDGPLPALDPSNSASSPESLLGNSITPPEGNAIEPPAAKSGKRKSAPDGLPKPRASIKDNRRKGSDDGTHTHDTDAVDGKKKTSERRKEQNRNAQRAFRERREQYARTLEGQIAAMQEEASARESENANLKELVGRLQTENARLAARDASFTFNVASSAAASRPVIGSAGTALNSSFATAANMSGPPASFSTKANASQPAKYPVAFRSNSDDSSGPVLDQSFGFFGGGSYQPTPFMPNGILAPLTPPSSGGDATPPNESLFGSEYKAQQNNFVPQQTALSDFFTPNGEHLNPMANFNDLFASTSTPLSSLDPSPVSAADDTVINALSPGSTAALFSAYRDPPSAAERATSRTTASSGIEFESLVATVSPPPQSNALRSSSDPALTLAQDKAGLTSEEDSCKTNITNQLKSLKGAEEFDIDALCSDMWKKATCKEVTRLAVSKAIKEGQGIQDLFEEMGGGQCFKKAYSKSS